jgi:hypothetical protein
MTNDVKRVHFVVGLSSFVFFFDKSHPHVLNSLFVWLDARP